MKTLSWNFRGLGNPRTIQDLCQMVEEKKPDIVFLMETWLKASKFEGLKRRMKCEGCFVVEPVGLKGGLAILWNNRV